jgi:DNA-directed RNA polymerase subunit beta'
MIETTVGRVLFNQAVPDKAGYINELLTKKSLRDIIGMVLKKQELPRQPNFLMQSRIWVMIWLSAGGLSFNLDDVIVPDQKTELVDEGYAQVEEVFSQLQHGFHYQ